MGRRIARRRSCTHAMDAESCRFPKRPPRAKKARVCVMDQSDKDRTKARHLRGMAKFEQRRDNLAERRKRGTKRPSRMKDEDDFEDGDYDYEQSYSTGRSSGSHLDSGSARALDATPNARVSAVARTQVHVLMDASAGQDGGEERVVRLTPRILAVGGLVVGDEVEVVSADRVVARGERRTVLQRRAPGQSKQHKVLAANVDIGLVVLAPRADGLSLGFVDRAIVALRSGDIEPVIVVTKMDLVGDEERARLIHQLSPWMDAGIGQHFISSPTGEGIPGLRAALEGRVAVVLGHSGVGKSTLVNALDPEATQLTGATREEDARGRHTTTSSRLIPWAGGALVDTPGIRQLAPDVEDIEPLARSIPELAPWLGRCRFTDCAHVGEPGCALEEAAEASEEVRQGLDRLRRLVESQQDDG